MSPERTGDKIEIRLEKNEKNEKSEVPTVGDSGAGGARKPAEPSPFTPSVRARIERKIAKSIKKRERYDQPAEAAEFYRLKRVPEGETEIPVERYIVAREAMRKMPQYSTSQKRMLPSRDEMRFRSAEAAIGEWESLGPGNVGGRTRALIIDPGNPQTMFAAGVAGGVWKSVNGGASWSPLSDLLPNIAVSSMAMDPKNSNVIYAGTGEGFFNIDAVRGAGIFRTTDGGNSWTRLESANNSDFHYVNDIVFSAFNSRRLYAATRTGVFRSTDGGESWTKILSTGASGGCTDLAIRQDQETDHLFAACGNFGQSTVYRNTIAGGLGEWVAVLSEPGMGRVSLAIAPSNQNVIYAAASSIASGPYQLGLFAVFRSEAGGEQGTWQTQVRNTDPVKLNTLLFSNPLVASLSECGFGPNGFLNQGWYDNVIAVDPKDPNRVWVGGIDLFRSDNGGVSWGLASYWWAEKSDPRYAHADHHAIVFHPQYDGAANKTMFAGTDGGIYRTDDARAPVATGFTAACNPNAGGVAWTSLNNNYGVTQFYHGAVFPDGKTFFGGTQDNGTLLGTESAGANGWKEIFGGDGGFVAINPLDQNQLFIETTRLSLRKSTDGGKTFNSAIFGINEPSANFSFITPYAVDPNDPQRMWIAGRKIWRSFTGGANWTAATPELFFQQTSAIAVSPTNPNYVAIGNSSGSVYLLVNGLYPDLISSPGSSRPPGSGTYVSSVNFDPKDYNKLYVTYSTFGGKHVWAGNLNNSEWTSLDGTGPNALPDIPVNCLIVDPDNSSRIYVGTDLGVFVTIDGGANWAIENSGFANAPVESMSLQSIDGVNYIYAFTHGRGVWRVRLGDNPCSYSLPTKSQIFTVNGGGGGFQVATQGGGCQWQASSNVNWISVDSTSNGAVNFTVAANSNGAQVRIGTIAVAGRSFIVYQDGRVNKISGFVDTEPPTLTFITPTAGADYVTKIGAVLLSGRVDDNIAIVGEASIVNDRGYSLTNNNTEVKFNLPLPWTSGSPIPLRPGPNKFTVSVRDPSGNIARASLTVTYTPEYSIDRIAGAPSGGFNGDNRPASSALLNRPEGILADGSGNIFIADSGNHRVRKIAADGIISTIAGTGERGLSGDGGAATAAQLDFPRSVALDASGNLYIADAGNNRIRKVSSNGVISTIAGSGAAGAGQGGFSGDGGLATEARLDYPAAVIVDSARNLFIADNYRVRKITASDGKINTIAGDGRNLFSGDGGQATAASFLNGPTSLAIDSTGNIYTAEFNRIRKISTNGMIDTIIGGGAFTGDSVTDQPINGFLNSVSGFAFDQQGNVFITDNSRELIHKVGADGIIRTIAGAGTISSYPNGEPATSVDLSSPRSIIVDPTGGILFINLHEIAKLKLIQPDVAPPAISITAPTVGATYSSPVSQITLSGTASDNLRLNQIVWFNDRGGQGNATGTGAWTALNIPLQLGPNKLTVVAWDMNGNSNSATITINYDPGIYSSSIAGTGKPGFNFETGTAASVQLWSPETVTFDAAGNMYIADKGNHRIRKVSRNGAISTFAGNGMIGSRGDGGAATAAELNSPSSIVFDSAGNGYIADSNNHLIRKVAQNGVITTFAGTGAADFSGDGGTAADASLDTPIGLAIDNAGNLLIADAGNHRIRGIDLQSGVIRTIAGAGYGDSPDGAAATEALLFFPTAIAVDKAGNLFISDTGNSKIRKVMSNGVMINLAGTGESDFNGDGLAARNTKIASPGGLVIDSRGNLYFTDQGNHRVRLITLEGTVSTVAGDGTPGLLPVGTSAFATRLAAPAGVTFDESGNLVIADTENHRVISLAMFRSLGNVSAASFYGPVAANNSIVAAFGTDLATASAAAAGLPLPTILAGTTVRVRDRLGVEREAQLFFVSPSQVNFLAPAETAAGNATVTITSGNGAASTGILPITTISPGLFSANADGVGVAAAVLLRIKIDGSQIYEPISIFDQTLNKYIPRPINPGDPSDQLFLILFGTGFRRGSGSTAGVAAAIGGVNAEVLYAGPQADFAGLDQLNLRLPRALAGRGEVDVRIIIDGKTANTVTIAVQ